MDATASDVQAMSIVLLPPVDLEPKSRRSFYRIVLRGNLGTRNRRALGLVTPRLAENDRYCVRR